jgi:alginate O-acetyltransferase complex protein AlgI
VNLVIVFALCGLWHGAAWTFLLWGLWHGAFLIAERVALTQGAVRPVQHAWTLLAVLGGWVLFRADGLARAGGYFAALAGAGHGVRATDLLTGDVLLAVVVGIPACLPLKEYLRDFWKSRPLAWAGATAEAAMCCSLFVASAAVLAAGSYNPFLYFRF